MMFYIKTKIINQRPALDTKLTKFARVQQSPIIILINNNNQNHNAADDDDDNDKKVNGTTSIIHISCILQD